MEVSPLADVEDDDAFVSPASICDSFVLRFRPRGSFLGDTLPLAKDMFFVVKEEGAENPS